MVDLGLSQTLAKIVRRTLAMATGCTGTPASRASRTSPLETLRPRIGGTSAVMTIEWPALIWRSASSVPPTARAPSKVLPVP